MISTGKNLCKKFMAMLLIIATVLSYFPIAIFAEDGATRGNAQYVKFDAEWAQGGTSITTEDELTNVIDLGLTLSGGPVFNNLNIYVEDITENRNLPNPTIEISTMQDSSVSANGHDLVFKKSISSGYQSEANVNLTFYRTPDFSEYDKTIQITLTGEYKLNDELIEINEVKTFNIHVVPKPVVEQFSSNVNCRLLKDKVVTKRYTSDRDFEIASFSMICEIPVQSANETYSRIVLNVDRTSPQDLDRAIINNDTNLKFQIMQSAGYTYNIVRETDGDTYIVFTRGTQTNSFDENTVKYQTGTIKVKIEYKVAENTSTGYGSTLVKASVNADVEGVTTVTNSQGKTYTKGNYHYDSADEVSLNIYSNVPGGTIKENDYDVWLNGVNCKEDDYIADIADNNFSVVYETQAKGWIEVKNELEQCKLFIYNYNRDENDRRASITYKTETGEAYSYICNDEMTLQKIYIENFSDLVKKVEFYKIDDDVNTATPFFTATSANDEYTVPSGEDLTEYYAVITGYNGTTGSHYRNLVTWASVWNVDINKLPSTINANNIRKITRRQDSNYYVCTYNGTTYSSGSLYDADCQDVATVYIDYTVDHYESYAELDLIDYNGDVSTIGEWEQNKEFRIKFNPTTNNSQRKVVKNEDAKLYVQLPEQYEYSNFNVELYGNTNGYVYLKSYDVENIDGIQYLVIQLKGTFNESEIRDAVGLTITHDRLLKTQDLPKNLPVCAYLLTLNEQYNSSKIQNTYSFTNSEGLQPNIAMMLRKYFSLEENNNISAKTIIFDRMGNECEPGEYTNGIAKKSSKSKPLIFEKSENVKYKSKIVVHDETINNIDYIIRLPKMNNTPITNSDIAMNSTMSLDLVNLSDIEIELYDINLGNTEIIDSSNYQLLYSTDETAGFDSSFQTLDNTVDLSTVKTLRIKFLNQYELESEKQINVIYKMRMPNPEGDIDAISGATTAVRYIKSGETEVQELESTPAYVKIGNPKGTITIEKKFEGVEEGDLPLDVSSLAGIQFKLINVDTNEPLVMAGQTTNEGIVETDADGKITLTDVEEGHYKLEELSTFTYYDGIDYTDVRVEQGTVTPNPVIALNKLKRGNLTVIKTWNESDLKILTENDNVEFKITRQNGLEFTSTKKLDYKTNTVTFYAVPYGTYDIDEEKGLYGWYYANDVKTKVLNSESDTFTANNKIARGTLIIEKTMPGDDDVRDITLRITGRGISYTDTNNNTISLDTNLTMKIRDYCDNTVENIHIDLNNSTKPTKAIITLSNLPLATYKIEEIDIPQMQDPQDPESEIDKYKPVATRRATINRNGETVRTSIENDWKTGSLRVIKTSEDGVDLSQFKVRVKLEESNYDAFYDKILDMPESGILTIPDLYLGKYSVTEVDSPYFNTVYGGENPNTPEIVEVFDGETSDVLIYNEVTYGCVKVLKTLEDKDAEDTIGLKFKISGKDATGADLTEIDEHGNTVLDANNNPVLGRTKEITEIYTDTATGKKYGTVLFENIQCGGEYSIEEVNTPDIYRELDEISVDVCKDNDVNNPKTVIIENIRKRGDLQITTKTVPEGGSLSPIKYRVTEVTLNSNYTFTKGDVIAELDGIAGFAQLTNIYAGTYLVEQTQVPEHYTKDYPQIVEVPDKGIGYAEFEIEKPELENTVLTIEKEIYTLNGTVATNQDFANAGLSRDEIFEVRITNIETNTTYFTFMNMDNPGKIKGLPAGTYEIEEVYKPKYLSSEYMVKNGDDYENIEKLDGKVLFTVSEPNEEGTEITIKIRNIINTNFGFAGQDSQNNFSKTYISETNNVTKTIIYVVNEEGKAVKGAKFKLYFENGREVPLSFDDNTYIVGDDTRLVINGLPVGKYTLKAIELPEGYLPVEDKEIVVYEGATRVTRIEVLKNIQRGNLTLSTTYTDDSGNKTFAPRSKYKILNSATGEVLKFVKTASGDYVASKLDSATDTINLRAGSVTVKNVGIGDYLVGLVDLTEEYGVIKEEPESVTVLQNQTVSREVAVKNRSSKFVKVVGSGYSGGMYSFALTEDGELYMFGNPSAGVNLYEAVEYSKITPSLENVKIKDIYTKYGYNSGFQAIVLIDDQGKIWTNYFGNEGLGTSSVFTCLNDIEGHPFNGLKFTKATITVNSGIPAVYAIDENGKVWFWGYIYNSFETEIVGHPGVVYTPICVSENNILDDVKIVDIDAGIGSYGSIIMAVDSNGKVYAWGNYPSTYSHAGIVDNELNNTTSDYTIVCVSETEGTSLKDVRVKSVAYNANGKTCFIDYDGNLWYCTSGNPVCVTTMDGNPLNGKVIESVTVSPDNVLVIDSDGKYWAWGYTSTMLGFGGIYNEDYDLSEPKCISDLEKSKIKNIKMKQVTPVYYGIQYGIDTNGELWCLNCYHSSDTYYRVPLGRLISNKQGIQKIDSTKNAYFDLFEVQDMSISATTSLIRDKSGKLWTPGSIANGYVINNSRLNLVDYFGSELGAAIENVPITTYDVGKDSTLIVDSAGKLWSIGYINNAYIVCSQPSGYESMEPLCITDIDSVSDNANPLYNKKIEYVATNKGLNSNSGQVAVIDSEGKIYTGGYYSAYNIGFYASQNNSDHYWCVPFKCINDEYDYLNDVIFKKVIIYDYYSMFAIDSNGNLWAWGYDNSCFPIENGEKTSYNSSVIKPTIVEMPNNAKISDVAVTTIGGIALSEDGDLYVWGNMYGDNGLCTKAPEATKTPVAVNGQRSILEGKHFVKIAVGYDQKGIAVDSDGEVFAITGLGYVKSVSESVPTGYGKVLAKDIYVGPSTLVVKDIFDDIYVLGNYSKIGGTGGTAVGDAYRMSDNHPNPLYGKTIAKKIAGNVYTVIENGAETIYVLDSNSGEVKSTRTVDSVKAYIGGVIFDNENHFYNIVGDCINCEYPDAVIEKLIYSDSKMVIIEDTEGNTYRITDDGVVLKVENVQLSKTLYTNSNLMIMSDTTGKLYEISDTAFTQLSGLDDGTVIEKIWAERVYYTTTTSGYTYKTGYCDIIFFQDSNNGLWVTMQTLNGSGNISSTWVGMSGIEGATPQSLKSIQKVTGYTGSEIKEMYINYDDEEVVCIDSNNNLWMWGNYSYAYLSKTPTVILENIVDFDIVNRNYSNAHLALDLDGNLYSFGVAYGTIQANSSIWTYNDNNNLFGVSYDNNLNSQIVNLSTNIGKVKQFYMTYMGALVITEDNKIYACVPGSEPILYDISYNDVEEIKSYSEEDHMYTSFGANLKAGGSVSFEMSTYYSSINVYNYNESISNGNIDNIKTKPTDGGTITPTDIVPEDITSDILSVLNTSTRLYVEDGKLYLRQSETTTVCISDQAGNVGVFGKQFKLIKDSKYKN